MSFRDDHDAALARITSLENEVETLRGEAEGLRADNARLEAENTELKKKVPKERPRRVKKPRPPEPADELAKARRERISKIAWRAGIALVVIGVFVGPAYCEHRRKSAWQAERAAYDAHAGRWRALTDLDECLRDSTVAASRLVGHDEKSTDPRSTDAYNQRFSPSSDLRSLQDRCVDKLEPLRHVDGLGTAIANWIAAGQLVAGPAKDLGTYYGAGDWKDDNYASAGGYWKLFRAPFASYVSAMEDTWKAMPAARAALRAMQADYAKQVGRSIAWWRIELGFIYEDLKNASIRKRPAEELVKLARELEQKITETPIELRRELRYLVENLDRIIAGQHHRGVDQLSDSNLWSKTDDVGKGPIPEPPEEPAGCGDGGAV